MEYMRLIAIPLAPCHKAKLLGAGYITVKDVQQEGIEELALATGLNKDEVEAVLTEVSGSTQKVCRLTDGATLLDLERQSLRILTFCEQLDVALGGGVSCGSITEICGVPGVGKTQLCIQLACDVQIPSLFGGLEGEAVYIDTKGGFVIEHVKDVAMATVDHCRCISQSDGDKDIIDVASAMTADKLLNGIHTYSCQDQCQVLAVVNLLPAFLRQNKKVRLMIIDNIAFPFRHDYDDLSLRTRVLTQLGQTLLHLAHQFNIAVVLTNQMTTKVITGSSEGSRLVPALGDSWGHACTTRLILHQDNSFRSAQLVKSPTQKPNVVPFQITEAGIRDVVSNQPTAHSQNL